VALARRRAAAVRAAACACALVCALVCAAACAPRGPAIRLRAAYLVLPAGDAPAVLYFTVRNAGSVADTMIGVDTDAGAGTSMHDERRVKGTVGDMTEMVPVQFVPIAGGGDVRFAPGGLHGMVNRLTRALTRGDTVHVTIRLAHSPPVTATAHVIAYADLDTAVAPASHR
jgi:hypothetical protein